MSSIVATKYMWIFTLKLIKIKKFKTVAQSYKPYDMF